MNQVKAIRYRAGISQRELAERAGIDVSTLSEIENGKTEPRAPTAFAIASALGVPVDDLLLPSDSGDSPAETPPGASESPQDGREDPTSPIGPAGNRTEGIEAAS